MACLGYCKLKTCGSCGPWKNYEIFPSNGPQLEEEDEVLPLGRECFRRRRKWKCGPFFLTERLARKVGVSTWRVFCQLEVVWEAGSPVEVVGPLWLSFYVTIVALQVVAVVGAATN